MRKILVAFSMLALVACDSDDGGADGPIVDGSTRDGGTTDARTGDGGGGTVDGVAIDALGAYGIDCENERLAGILEVEGEYCVPAAPYLKTLVGDCQVIADGGCRPTFNGCAAGAVLSLASQAYDSNIPAIGGTCREEGENGETIFSIDCTLYYQMLDNPPAAGNPDSIAVPLFPGESQACFLNVFDDLSPLGQWLFREYQNPPEE